MSNNKARMCTETMSVCCALSTVERTMQSLVLCGPACETLKQTAKGKRSKLFSVNGPSFKPKDNHHGQLRSSPLRKRLRVPLSLVIPCDSITDDSINSHMRGPAMQHLCVPENALEMVEGVCPPLKRLVV